MSELLLKALRYQRKTQTTTAKGFTLIELLVVVLISGGIISGLMFMVVELLTADQKEASKNQTQQEMQMAMDYISAELREAVYIYDSACLSDNPNGAIGDDDYCPGLTNHLPAGLNDGDTTPILAFWKQEQLPEVVRNACGTGDATTTDPNTPCIAGHAYSLVVYSTDTSENNKWDGKSRITRYSLDRYQIAGTNFSLTSGYVDPSAFSNEFRSWPFYQGVGDTVRINQQAAIPDGGADVLVDFVDDAVQANTACPTGYGFSTDKTVTGFYGCVSDDDATTANRDIILSLRGNAVGRPAINGDASFLPALETHVLSRPVLGKAPN